MEVIIVDSDSVFANRLSDAFSKYGLHSTHVETANEALSRILKADFDLVVTEYLLSGESGLELCETLKEFSYIPVIFYSVDSSCETAARCLDAGADDYIRKGLTIKEVMARVRAVLRRT